MKKLQKLRLHEMQGFNLISENEQMVMKGGTIPWHIWGPTIASLIGTWLSSSGGTSNTSIGSGNTQITVGRDFNGNVTITEGSKTYGGIVYDGSSDSIKTTKDGVTTIYGFNGTVTIQGSGN